MTIPLRLTFVFFTRITETFIGAEYYLFIYLGGVLCVTVINKSRIASQNNVILLNSLFVFPSHIITQHISYFQDVVA